MLAVLDVNFAAWSCSKLCEGTRIQPSFPMSDTSSEDCHLCGGLGTMVLMAAYDVQVVRVHQICACLNAGALHMA